MKTSNMLQSITAATALLAGAQVFAQDLIAYDGFDYPSTPNLYGANGGFGWSSQWFKLSQIPTGVVSGTLYWPCLQTGGGTAITAPYPSADLTRYSRALVPYTDPDDTVYLSVLVQPNIGYGVTGGLAFGTWDNGMVMGACPRGYYGLMTPPDTAWSDTEVPYVQDSPALMVARVHKNPGGTITWSLFVNPAVGSSEPAQPDAELTIPGDILPPAVFLYNDGGFLTDEIRVGHTWASVLTPVAIVGDVTANGNVDIDDLLAVINHWGACAAPCPADVNSNGEVDMDDLLAVINHWGPCP